MKELLKRLPFVLAALACSSAVSACGIVYGKDWAFLSETPPGWSSACHKQAMEGTVITLWRSDQKPDSADSLIYVTVSSKDLSTLQAFADDAIARFRSSAPSVRVSQLKQHEVPATLNMKLVSFSGAPPGNREECVAYIEGPTAYFIAVITAESAKSLAARKEDFLGFLGKFIPMEKR